MEMTKEQKLLSDILHEAWENKSFKQKLIADPVAEIEKLIGEKINVPEGKELIVQDQTQKPKIYINIPPKPQMDDVELNEEELDLVSGGDGVAPPKLGDISVALDGFLDG